MRVIDGLGKIGVLVALESTGKADELTALGRQIAMHVAAANPLGAGCRRPRSRVVAPREGRDGRQVSRSRASPTR
jgi:translation elongation factor EF-Ts